MHSVANAGSCRFCGCLTNITISFYSRLMHSHGSMITEPSIFFFFLFLCKNILLFIMQIFAHIFNCFARQPFTLIMLLELPFSTNRCTVVWLVYKSLVSIFYCLAYIFFNYTRNRNGQSALENVSLTFFMTASVIISKNFIVAFRKQQFICHNMQNC